MKLVLLIASLLLADVSKAAIFQVNLTDTDNIDVAPGNGVCKIPGIDFCTLRAAVMEANALPGNDIIVLPGAALIELTIEDAGDNSAASGDLDITDNLTLGSFIEPIEDFPTVSALGINDRIFDVGFGAGNITFVNFKIINGNASANSQNGGAIRINAFNEVEVLSVWFQDNVADSGGAIYVNGASELSVIDSVFRANAVTETGAAISALGETTIIQSTFFEHVNLNGVQAETLYITHAPKVGAGLMMVDNSTLFNNNGSAIYSNGGRIVVNNSTLVDNGRFGLLATPGPFATRALIRNTVFNNNALSDCSVTADVTVDDVNHYNMSSNISCLNGGSTNLIGNPDLSLVRIDANDWHRYFRPNFYSPLVDSASPASPGISDSCEVEDQLGLTRATEGGDRCDRGAIELSSDIIFFDGLETPE
ncbi:MAG: hypothetical protein ACSHWU_13035 [Marinicella sp.]